MLEPGAHVGDVGGSRAPGGRSCEDRIHASVFKMQGQADHHFSDQRARGRRLRWCMGIGLEKRLRRLEKVEQAKTDKLIDDQEELVRREELRKLRSTPEGRRLVRTLAMESAERIVSAMRTRERAQLEKMTSPEQLERLRKKWAEEDAKEKARRKQYAEWEAQMAARGNIPCQCRDCARVREEARAPDNELGLPKGG